MTACFPGLRREYLPFLPQIGIALGTFLESPRLANLVVVNTVGLPLVHILILDPAKLPSQIDLLTLVEGWIL